MFTHMFSHRHIHEYTESHTGRSYVAEWLSQLFAFPIGVPAFTQQFCL